MGAAGSLSPLENLELCSNPVSSHCEVEFALPVCPFSLLFSPLTLITPGADQWQPLVIDLDGHSSVAAPGQY